MNRKELILKIKEVLNFDDLTRSTEKDGWFLISKFDMSREEVILKLDKVIRELDKTMSNFPSYPILIMSPVNVPSAWKDIILTAPKWELIQFDFISIDGSFY